MKASYYTYKFTLCILLLLLGLIACKKNSVPAPTTISIRTVQDSVYHYYSLYSLWKNRPWISSSELYELYQSEESVEGFLLSLKNFSASYDQKSTNAKDRYSYIQEINLQSNKDNSNSRHGLGLNIRIAAISSTEAYPVIYMVDRGSPAAKAGLIRSDIIKEIDQNTDLLIPIQCRAGICNFTDQTKYVEVLNILANFVENPAVTLKIQNPAGSLKTIDLHAARYTISPIIKVNTLDINTEKIGYLALTSFEDVQNNNQNYRDFEAIFADFEQQSIRELIIDLRYNLGGQIDAATYLANKIAPESTRGKLMYSLELNAYLESLKAKQDKRFEDVYFAPRNNLKIKRIFFLVSNQTASAAELVINIISPYMQVITIGSDLKTFGKPVGYFKQEIMGKYNLWVASFKINNALGYGDYWEGISPDITDITDNYLVDFGNIREDMLGKALSIISNENVIAAPKAQMKLKIGLPINLLEVRSSSTNANPS